MKTPREKSLPEVLGEYAKRDMARFHMPGHKGFGIPMAEQLCAWDITELPGTDNLHMPEGAIRKTQDAYAQAYGARDCFLLVNGSTAGVIAMLLALGQNKRVLLARNCHKSAVSGAALAGHTLSFFYPQEGGAPTSADVETALKEQSADAVLLVSPDPYGRCADLVSIAEVVHRHGALLLVDAAHGAHFPFAPALPDLCAEHVDMFCVSAHKTLNAFTQTALLFAAKRCPLERAHLQSVLSLVQSSSPSYPLMASLDWALHAVRGWQEHALRMQTLQKRLAAANGIRVQSAENALGQRGIAALDPTRIVLDVHARGITGQDAYADLFSRGIAAEMADKRQVVFITTPHDPPAWFDRLYDAVCTLPYGISLPEEELPCPPHTAFALCVRDAVLSDSHAIPLEQSAGRIAASAVGLYPPGVALLYPGERITEEAIAYLEAAASAGHSIFGLEEKTSIRVVR